MHISVGFHIQLYLNICSCTIIIKLINFLLLIVFYFELACNANEIVAQYVRFIISERD